MVFYDRINETADALDSLRLLLVQDLAQLEASSAATMREGHRKKVIAATIAREELANLFQAMSEQAEKDELPDVSGLRQQLGELVTLAEQHRRTLAGAIDATKERINVVVDARRRAAAPHETYGPNAAIRPGPVSRHALTMSSRKV